MLGIRVDQMQRLKRSQRDAFVAELVRSLQTHYPNLALVSGPQE